MDNNELILERDGSLAVLTLNRPERTNKLTDPLLTALGAQISDLQDDGKTRAVVLKAAGDVFCDGFDVGAKKVGASPKERTRADFAGHAALVSDTLWRMWRSPLPIVAAVQGRCLGGAVYLSAVCDFVVTTPDAQIGMSELKLGMAPPLFNIFPWLLNNRTAREFLFLGEVVGGDRAVEIGLATRSVPSEQLLSDCMKLARDLAAMPDSVVASMKRSVNRRWESAGMVAGIEQDVEAFVEDKIRMGPFQKEFRRLLREVGGDEPMEKLGINLNVRGIINPWK